MLLTRENNYKIISSLEQPAWIQILTSVKDIVERNIQNGVSSEEYKEAMVMRNNSMALADFLTQQDIENLDFESLKQTAPNLYWRNQRISAVLSYIRDVKEEERSVFGIRLLRRVYLYSPICKTEEEDYWANIRRYEVYTNFMKNEEKSYRDELLLGTIANTLDHLDVESVKGNGTKGENFCTEVKLMQKEIEDRHGKKLRERNQVPHYDKDMLLLEIAYILEKTHTDFL